MKRDELAHVLRASAAISNETSLHDLVASKCAAGRDKDADFVRILLANGSVAPTTLLERIAMLDPAKHNLQHIIQWTQRRAQEATE